tara:strand:+ start:222 stop:431 length:210 start_codon:yes stop_codon:yes gene_type:complete
MSLDLVQVPVDVKVCIDCNLTEVAVDAVVWLFAEYQDAGGAGALPTRKREIAKDNPSVNLYFIISLLSV